MTDFVGDRHARTLLGRGHAARAALAAADPTAPPGWRKVREGDVAILGRDGEACTVGKVSGGFAYAMHLMGFAKLEDCRVLYRCSDPQHDAAVRCWNGEA